MISNKVRYGWLLLILLTAAFLRLHNLSDVPPGLTHDEADHGLDAWGVVNGIRPIYFTVGYGREPLFDYSTALFISFLGPTYLAGRLTAVTFSLLLIAAAYAWTRRAFDDRTALFTAAGLAVGFWTVMSGRQALRSVMLPALFVLALTFFWYGLQRLKANKGRLNHGAGLVTAVWQRPAFMFLLAGLFLGMTFYTYIPSRILWLLFPLLLGYLALIDRPLFRRAWGPTVAMLLITAVVALPLFHYLVTHPTAEARIEQLSAPLAEAQAGNFGPLLENTRGSLRLFTIEGDSAWRYNIPGRPFLQPVMAVLFYAGLIVALGYTLRPFVAETDSHEKGRSAASFLALAWLIAGTAPVFVTGPELSMTQAIGMQPALYLFPALALSTLLNLTRKGWPMKQGQPLAVLIPLALFGATAVVTARDYFVIWANAPEVRLHYETALVTAVRYLNEQGHGPAAISTATPNRFHSPAAAFMTLNNPTVSLRWFDGRYSLLLPQDNEASHIVFVGAALNPALAGYFNGANRVETLALRSTDLVRPITIYTGDGRAMFDSLRPQFSGAYPGGETSLPVNFGDAVDFWGYDLQSSTLTAGDWVQLATLWQVKRPLDDLVLFTHLLDETGEFVTQADRLDVPSYYWHSGDIFIQLHELQIPADVAPGDYALYIGLYSQATQQRLPFLDGRAVVDDRLSLQPLTISP